MESGDESPHSKKLAFEEDYGMIPPEKPKPQTESPLAVNIFKAILILGALLIILAVGGWFFKTFLLPERIVPNPKLHAGVGERLTYLELQPLTGNQPPVSLQNLSGRVVLLNFWGTWCSFCRDELPQIAELRHRYAGHEDFRLLAISYPAGGQSDDVQSLREETALLLKRLNLDLPTYHDPNDKTLAEVDHVIGFKGFPTSVLLDRRGVVRAVWSGYMPGMETEVERSIGAVLEEKN
jgi:thiol-disulfide isomerase/thioredoxin